MRSPVIFCLLLALTTAPVEAAADTLVPVPNAKLVRIDPYKNFKFRVVIDGRSVAGFGQMNGLPGPTQIGGRRTTPPVTLYHGVSHDRPFVQWVAGSHATRETERTDITLVLQNETGHAVRRYKFLHAWVSKYSGVSNLDANANEVAIESITIDHEGIEIDQQLDR